MELYNRDTRYNYGLEEIIDYKEIHNEVFKIESITLKLLEKRENRIDIFFFNDEDDINKSHLNKFLNYNFFLNKPIIELDLDKNKIYLVKSNYNYYIDRIFNYQYNLLLNNYIKIYKNKNLVSTSKNNLNLDFLLLSIFTKKKNNDYYISIKKSERLFNENKLLIYKSEKEKIIF